jgi:protein tyrosine/serine phosphatase
MIHTKKDASLRYAVVYTFVILILAAEGFAQELPRVRPPEWGQPVINAGVCNFFKVDENVYRSAQPDMKGMKTIESMGIRNVLSLSYFLSDEYEAQGTQLKLFRTKMIANEIHEEEVIQALRIIRTSEGPILVHCWHGSDRTGCIIAMYRILNQGWSKEQAIDEMVNGGYGFHGGDVFGYKNIIRYIREADIEKIKKLVTAPE